MIDQATLQNRILSRLSPDDFALLDDKLEFTTYRQSDVLMTPGEPVSHACFLESGVASVVVESPEGLRAEGGIIGREGFIHPALALGSDQFPQMVEMQIADEAYRIARSDLVAAMAASSTLRGTLLRFAQAYFAQVTSTALSNAVHQVDERLARWLLMIHDRSASDDLELTHDFMSVMLAVRRPSVTNALHVLEGNGFIENVRGCVTIRNRAALELFASDAYGVPEAEYRRLLGPL